MYIVSACLLGENVKYSGGNNFTEAVVEFLKDKEFIPVCPEVLGGLTIPREPCERLGDRVINKSGADVTEAFHKGAERCLEGVLEKVSPEDIEGARILAQYKGECLLFMSSKDIYNIAEMVKELL